MLTEEHWCTVGAHWWRCDLYYLESALVDGKPHGCPFPLVTPCGQEDVPNG